MTLSPPTSPRSPEDSIRSRAQLRLAAGNRRKSDYRKPTSVEKGAHRRKAPPPTGHAFAGAGECMMLSPPTSPRSPEDSRRSRVQLRPAAGNRRRADHRNRNSVEKCAHRRKAPTPTRHAFAGGEASANLSPPRRPCSSEDRVQSRTQLRPEPGIRSRADLLNPTFDERTLRRRTRHPRAVDDFVQKVFTIFDTFPFTNYTYRGIIICIQPKLKNFVK